MSDLDKNLKQRSLVPPEILPLEVIISGYNLDDYVSDNFKENIKKLYNDQFEIRFANINIVLIDKEALREAQKNIDERMNALQVNLDEQASLDNGSTDESEGRTLNIKIPIPISLVPTTLSINHRNERDYKDNILNISSNNEIVMDILLKSYKEVLKIEE